MKNVGLVLQCIIFVLLSTVTSYGQDWEALNPPLNIFNGTIYTTCLDSSGNVYAAGSFTNSSNNQIVAKWDGENWNELGSGSSSLHANYTIIALAAGINGGIYAAGAFVNSSGYNYVAFWNGNEWSEIGGGATAINANGLIYSLVTDKSGSVYAAGNFTNNSGKCYVAKWNGSKWNELGSGTNALNANGAILSVTTDSSGNIYAGGRFKNSDGNEYVAKWDGITWSEVGTGINALKANDFINSLATDGEGNLYAGGTFRDNSNQYYLAKWNGTGWSATGSGATALNVDGGIQTIAVRNVNEIYVAGNFSGMKKWNGISWSEVNSAQNPFTENGTINSILIGENGNIYAGGKFTNKSGHNFIAKWNGIEWSEPGSKGDPFYTGQPIYQIVADTSGNVYVSGYFKDQGGAYYLQFFNGYSWNELSPPDTSGMRIEPGASNVKIAVDLAGNLYTGGIYSGKISGYKCILKWNGEKWSKLEDYPNELNAIDFITDLQTDKYGNVYASGNFSDSASTKYSIAKWDGRKWLKLSGSFANISDFCVSDDGNIYAYGSSFYGSNGYYIANFNLNSSNKWMEVKNPDSSGFAVPGTNVFRSLAIDSRNNLFVNGVFTNATGKRYLAKWDEKNWSLFGITDKLGYALTLDKKDSIYSTGEMILPTTYDCNVKKWNGTSWIGLGTPLTSADALPLGDILGSDLKGNIYSISPSNEPGVGSFIVRYDAASLERPKIISFSPDSGSLGTKVLITGRNFSGTTSVKFGGTPASSFTIYNDSSISATVAEGSTGSVFIKTPAGSDSLKAFKFTCDSINKPIPEITSFGDTLLLSTQAKYYQWYFNNIKISNEIFDSLNIKSAGFYRVATSTNKLCWVSSLDYPILLNSNPLSDTLKMNLYPNPSKGSFTVEVKLPQTTNVVAYVTIFDANGIEVLQTNKLIFFGREIKIPVTINAKGAFFITVYINGDSRKRAIIIM